MQQTVEQFIRSEKLGSEDFPGGFISAFRQGPSWQVAVGLRDNTSAPGGHMTSDIAANIESMLSHALNDKARKLEAMSGFDRVGLVFLNTYFFGDDVDDVASRLCKIISENPKYSVFSIVFYITNGSLHVIYDKSTHAVS